MNVERAEDVLVHKKLLHVAHDPATRIALAVRLVQVNHLSCYFLELVTLNPLLLVADC